MWESGINSEDGAVSLFRFRSNTSGWWGKFLKKSEGELGSLVWKNVYPFF